MDLPVTLRPSGEIDVALPSGGAIVRLPVCRPVFAPVEGRASFHVRQQTHTRS